MSGWIKLHRSILEWEWYDDTNVRLLFLHILVSANYKPKNWKGVEIRRGQLMCSLPNLAKSTGLSLQQVRTAISKLKSTGEITDRQHAGGRLITVVGYESYQSDNSPSNSQSTGNQQANNRQVTGEQQQHKKERRK